MSKIFSQSGVLVRKIEFSVLIVGKRLRSLNAGSLNSLFSLMISKSLSSYFFMIAVGNCCGFHFLIPEANIGTLTVICSLSIKK